LLASQTAFFTAILCPDIFAQAPSWRLPFTAGETWIVTCGYGCGAHTGNDAFALDFGLSGCNAWAKPILAVAAGTIIEVAGGTANTCGTLSYGLRVRIDHGGGYVSTYAHLSEASVTVGQVVCQGQMIGRCGNSGNACGSACPQHPGTHLHFHIRFNGGAYKPEPMSGYTNFVGSGSYTSNNVLSCALVDDAAIVSHTIPAQLTPGQQLNVGITVRNAGTTTWTADFYKLGAVEDSDPFAATRHLLNAGETVAPGAQRTFTIPFVAPFSTGMYTTDWRMVRDGVAWFGETLTRQVEVSNTAAVIIIESRAGGQNHAWYSEQGVWADAGATSGAAGVTPAVGSRYGSTWRSAAGLKIATFAPQLAAAGPYRVSTTWPNGQFRVNPILHRMTHSGGVTDIQVDQTAAHSQWLELGTFTFNAGAGGSVKISNEQIDISGGAMYASAVRFEQIITLPIPGDFDGDGDVDMADFGHLQRCYTGPGIPQNETGCLNTRLDGDSDVDADDFGIFQGCLSGPNQPGNPDCAG